MSQPSRNRPTPPTSPDVVAIRKDSQTMERELVFAMTKSHALYKQARELVCPFDPSKSAHRRDFTVPRYNTLFRAIDAFYRRFDNAAMPVDFGIPPQLLSTYMVDWANRNQLSVAEAQELLKEIDEEATFIGSLRANDTMLLLNSEGFRDWLKQRVLDHTITSIDLTRRLGHLTLENFHEHVDKMKQSLSHGQSTDFVNGGSLVRGTSLYTPAFGSGLTSLNRALGGGFRRAETTLIAAINAGGKTILAAQLAKHFAFSGCNVAVFTTEQRPDEYICRMVSNHTNITFDQFVNRADVSAAQNSTEILEVPTLPNWMWQDPQTAQMLVQFEQIATSRILFVDWSHAQGYTIPGHFESRMSEMTRLGWVPDVVIFDWIGGGLDKSAAKDKLRLFYEEAVNFLVDHGKRTNRVMIALAQLNKAKVKNSTRRITADMLSECTTMTNNVANFIGITGIRENEDEEIERPRLARNQFFYMDKVRKGPGGLIPVDAAFQFQRFADRALSRITGGA